MFGLSAYVGIFISKVRFSFEESLYFFCLYFIFQELKRFNKIEKKRWM